MRVRAERNLAAGSESAHPSLQIEVLRGNVSFPFIFRGEGTIATCEIEDAGESPSVRGCDVSLESRSVFEAGGDALFAGETS